MKKVLLHIPQGIYNIYHMYYSTVQSEWSRGGPMRVGEGVMYTDLTFNIPAEDFYSIVLIVNF